MEDSEEIREPTIQRTKISIITKKKEKQKRNTKIDPTIPIKRPNLILLEDDKCSLNDVTLIHRADGLPKDEAVLKNKLNLNLTKAPNFTCYCCDTSFYSAVKLKMHFLIEHKVLYCKICDILIETDQEKAEHDQRVHAGTICEICQEKVQGEMAEHYSQAHDAIICRYCDVLLHPRIHYGKHLVEKHCTTETFMENLDWDNIIEKSKGCSFFCKMCEKNRFRELFGHFIFHHKINTYYLANCFIRQNIEVKLTLVGEDDEMRAKIAQKSTATRDCCKICMGIYTTDIPKSFHKVFCQGKTYCPLCEKILQNGESLEIHMKESHDFSCKNCDHKSESLKELELHYQGQHKLILCDLCDELIADKLEHMQKNHAFTGENFFHQLISVEYADLCCTLCNKCISEEVENIRDLLAHYKVHHSMAMSKILNLIGEKPTISKNETEESNTESDSDSLLEGKFNDLETRTDFNPKFVKCHFELPTLKRIAGETTCEMCNEKCSSSITLISHLHDAHGFSMMDKVMECTNCNITDRSFKMETHINHYIDKECMKMEIFDCKKCYFAMTVEDARGHILEKHRDELESFSVEDCGMKCRFCKASFWERDEVEKHELSNHFDEHKREFYECYNCFNNFCSVSSIKQHIVPIKTECESFKDIIFECTVCFSVYPTIPNIREHFEESHPKLKIIFCPAKNCKKSFTVKKYVKQHFHYVHERKIREAINHECEICSRVFPNKKSYLLHSKNSHAKGHKCVICGDKFSTADLRKYHYTTVHPGELVYECTECQKTFLSKSGLHVHAKLHNDFSSVCNYCGKEFFRRDSYKEHLLIHIGPKHQCTYCPKVFTQKSNLRRHIRLHTGEKPYNCPHCPKKFSDKGACNSHITVHTRDQECYCEVCGKKFSKQQKLKYHMKRHTGEGLVRCDVCHRGFTSQYDLRKHQLTHDQQTQIICECGRGFSSEKYLRTHIKVVHDPQKANQPIKKKKSNFNCYQCLVCKNIYSLRTTVLKHLRNIHKLDRKEYGKNMRQLEPEEKALFTPTVLEEQVDASGKVELHAMIQIKQQGVELEGEIESEINPPQVSEVAKKPRNRKHKKPSKYLGNEVDDELV